VPTIDEVIAALEERIARNHALAKQVEEFKNQLAPPKRRSERVGFEIDPRWLRNTHARQREQFIEEHLSTLRVKKFEWDESEVQALTGLIIPGQDTDWKQIGQRLGRSAADCRIKFEHFVAPNVNTEPWTKDEDLLLVSLVTKYKGFAWDKVATEIKTGRTAAACFQRYQRTLNPALGGEFTHEDDKRLMDYMQTHSTCSWSQITADLDFPRNPDQVARRWKTLSRPVATTESRWTEEQDAKLVKLAEIYGEKSWQEIAEFFPDKSDIRCRERYQDVVKPGLRQSNIAWTADEDEQLLVSVILHGVGNWAGIVKDLPGRTDRACQQRWKILDPVAAKEHYEKKRIARRIALSSSSGRELERTELTPEDLLKVMVPADRSVGHNSTSYPQILYEGPVYDSQEDPSLDGLSNSDLPRSLEYSGLSYRA
jgi:hypothetical protein